MTEFETLAGAWWRWMAPMSVQVTLLAGALVLLDPLLRRCTWPRLRAALWTLVMVKLLLPPGWGAAWTLAAWLGRAGAPTGASGPAVATGTRLPATLGLVWLAVLLALAGFTIWRRRRTTMALRADSRTAPPHLGRIALRAATRIGLRRPPVVRISRTLAGPLVCGVLRPIVLLPERLVERSPLELEHVLLHELTHVRRRDPLVAAACSLLQMAYWFHPFVWLARRRLEGLRELCCDAAVAECLGERSDGYRRTLLRLGGAHLEHDGVLALSGRSGGLLERLDELQRRGWRHTRSRRAATALLSTVLLVGVLPMGASDGAPGPHPSVGPVSPLAEPGCLRQRYRVLHMLANSPPP